MAELMELLIQTKKLISKSSGSFHSLKWVNLMRQLKLIMSGNTLNKIKLLTLAILKVRLLCSTLWPLNLNFGNRESICLCVWRQL